MTARPPPSIPPREIDHGPDPAAATLDDLRGRIRAIERWPARDGQSVQRGPAWTLGTRAIDDRLGAAAAGGLQIGAVHEIKPADRNGECRADWPSSWAAARGFALRLAARRLMSPSDNAGRRAEAEGGDVLWCATTQTNAEFGDLHGSGLLALGCDPSRFIIVETARQQEALWALEQGVKSSCLALAVAQIDEIDLTPARRLALAAAASGTPCLLLTHPASPVTAATSTRWRIGPAPSASHPFAPHAPGRARFSAALERCRGRPSSANAEPVLLEWCDAAYRFHMAAAVADRADATGRQESAA